MHLRQQCKKMIDYLNQENEINVEIINNFNQNFKSTKMIAYKIIFFFLTLKESYEKEYRAVITKIRKVRGA